MLMRYVGETDFYMFINGKIYEVLEQDQASGWWHIIDESGEAYMYPSIENFEPLKID